MNNVFVVNTLVDMYGIGNPSAAWFAFDCLTNRNVISWMALLDACTQNGYFEESLKLFVEMQIDGVQPNELTYSVVLYSCAGLSDRTNGNALTAHVEKLGYMSHLMVGNALINMHTKSGCIDDAWRIFTALPLKNAISFNSMIIGFSHHGHGEEALKIFHSMMEEKVVPTYVTFIGVLLACGHLHLVDEGYYFFDHLMKGLGIEAGVEHHTCMVGLLCRTGLLDDAYNYLRTIDTEWDVVAWRTLLSACQFYKKFELGEKVVDQIVNLYPHDIGTYVLLSNMFAKSNKWAGVMKIRKFMREQRIKKEPEVSWIHVRNEVHVFASEDDKHPLKAHIYGKLTELIKEIRAIGYVPNLASVLHDVEDEQKEEYLSFHSEKLAIAFGLISTPSEAPIYVMKNLRMCNDCHSAVKLISSVARKKIVVRDANRFHCFQNGLCSCGEYW
ncbi:Pentatricopeptide repeat-containing protein [Apostasia shenzhenica]|uniref:Pentatricopeptide repeat-containing protein n=1 Tax=Apostasia shenzhenica TaxID=1088818 RepID=A0A2I0AD70_9ASPA|nr:Pentatricopeptide repeat-containing protein [Apostasia shenzhenica]